ncbi:hypothetical protein ACTQWG_15220 [Blautia sp. HCP3S3_H10_1]|uniref:hypothetical protein n=1 Tax=unclassified Blautia TaxID=2648079 RepID=UPI003F8F6CE5|nr:hypothetical protein [Clostridia bacterium]
MKKLLVASILAGTMLLGSTSLVSAEHIFRNLGEPVYQSAATEFSGGDGSEESPYEISSAQELQLLSDLLGNPDDRTTEYGQKNYILTADISLNDVSSYESWKEKRPEYDWRPIGRECNFTGVFDGNGHTISGLYINAEKTEDDGKNTEYGLFANSFGTIKNLSVENAYVEVSGYPVDIGILAGGLSKEGNVTDCTINGTVNGYDGHCGGVVGNASDCGITNCEFNGTVTAAGKESQVTLGGIAGYYMSSEGYDYSFNEELDYGSFVIQACVNKGTISLEDAASINSHVGGIVGSGDGNIINCVNEGTVEGSDEDKSGSANAGGIIGYLSGNNISSCTNKGSVTCQGGNAGGIAGVAHVMDSRFQVEISDCVNEGMVSAPGYYYAGIVGDTYVNGKDGVLTISGCTNQQDFTEGEGAGIVHHASLSNNGNMVLKDDVNYGAISTEGQDAAGILAYVTNMGANWNLTVERCVNTGDIQSSLHAGGIVCFTYFPATQDQNTTFTVTDCENSGNLSTSEINGYIGGIVAADGLMLTRTQITGCKNSGDITFEGNLTVGKDEKETVENKNAFTLSVTGGGIVGRVGQSLLLSTDADKPDKSMIGLEDALVTISDCESTGNLTSQKPETGEGVSEEFKEKYADVLWKSSLGGILGDCSCVEGYSVKIENCTHNAENEIGNPELQ